MGFFNSITEWNKTRHEKHIASMRDKGHCPQCYGKGFQYSGHEYAFYMASIDCPGCNGSGAYADWETLS